MTHRACRSRARTGHLTATGPVTPTRSRDRWGRAEAQRTALGEALVLRRRTRVRFPPPPPLGLGEMPGPLLAKSQGHRGQRCPRLSLSTGHAVATPRRGARRAGTPPPPWDVGVFRPPPRAHAPDDYSSTVELDVEFVTTVPRSPTGKILRRLLSGRAVP